MSQATHLLLSSRSPYFFFDVLCSHLYNSLIHPIFPLSIDIFLNVKEDNNNKVEEARFLWDNKCTRNKRMILKIASLWENIFSNLFYYCTDTIFNMFSSLFFYISNTVWTSYVIWWICSQLHVNTLWKIGSHEANFFFIQFAEVFMLKGMRRPSKRRWKMSLSEKFSFGKI